jgi:hypothetical protein
MSETILIRFPDISGDVGTYTAFLRHESTGALLNTGGDTITESGSTGLWSFTLDETRAENTNYDVAVYDGVSEDAAALVYDGILRAGLLRVDEEFDAQNSTYLTGTVGAATTPSKTQFTPSYLSTAASAANQLINRIIVFDNRTTTAALRGQITRISVSSGSALPLLTFGELTTAPASGDIFKIV